MAIDIDVERRIRPKDVYNFDLHDIADWTCLPVYTILDSFLPLIQSNSIPICTPGYLGSLNMTKDLLHPREKFQQDNIVLSERFLPKIKFLSHYEYQEDGCGPKLAGVDELTKGLLKTFHTTEISLWIVLALQVHVDTYYILLSDTMKPRIELAVAVSTLLILLLLCGLKRLMVLNNRQIAFLQLSNPIYIFRKIWRLIFGRRKMIKFFDILFKNARLGLRQTFFLHIMRQELYTRANILE
jgi:hypothetical protein